MHGLVKQVRQVLPSLLPVVDFGLTLLLMAEPFNTSDITACAACFAVTFASLLPSLLPQLIPVTGMLDVGLGSRVQGEQCPSFQPGRHNSGACLEQQT